MNCGQKLSASLAALVALLNFAGCGSSVDPLPTAKVTGTVTIDGKPFIKGASVLFQPEITGKMATGIVQNDGSFELTTYAPGDGAVVGKHRVAVIPVLPLVPDNVSEISSALETSIPVKYQSHTSSGLECKVTTDGPNQCHLELQSE